MQGANKLCTLILTCYLLSLLVQDRLLKCEALFNRGNNNNGNKGNDGSNKNRIAIHDGGKVKNKNADDLMQSINDAATGTVKQTAPGNERPPTSCNEMMARAVVLANEERALAYDERDEALATAQQAFTQLGEAKLKLEDATSRVSEIEQEIHELQESTANTIKEIKEDARLEIETNFNKTHLEMEKLKNETSVRILKHEMEKNEAIDVAERKSAKEIADYKQNRDEEVAQIREEAKAQMDNATNWVLQIQNATRIDIENIEAKAKNMVHVANARAEQIELDANATIINVRNDANETIQFVRSQANQKVEQANANFTQQKLEMEDTMKKTKENATRAIDRSRRDAEVAIEEMKAAMEKKEERLLKEQTILYNSSNATVKTIREEAAAKVKAAEEAAEQRIEQMKKEAEAQMAATEKSAAARIAAIEKELESAQNEAKRLVAAVEKLKNEGYRYAHQVSNIADELAHWKRLHQSQQYCNVTLMKVDSTRALSRAATVFTEESKKLFDKTSTTTSQQFDRASLLVRQKSEPHLKKMNEALDPHIKSFRETYESSPLKETVDKTVYPLYRQHVVPVFPATQRLSRKVLHKIKHLVGQSWEFTIKKSVKVARWELKLIESNPKLVKYIPSFVIHFLEYIRDNMEEWLLLKIKVTALIIAFVLRRRLIETLISAVQLPFHVAWFFCPLRFCIKGGTKVKEERKEDNKRENHGSSKTEEQMENSPNEVEGLKQEETDVQQAKETKNGTQHKQNANHKK